MTSDTTYCYTVIDDTVYKVPYNLRTGVVNWNRAKVWHEPPSKVSDVHGPIDLVPMRCDVCGRRQARKYVGHCRVCGGWMRPV